MIRLNRTNCKGFFNLGHVDNRFIRSSADAIIKKMEAESVPAVHKDKVIIFAVIFAALFGIGLWYWQKKNITAPSPQKETAPAVSLPQTEAAKTQSLGAGILEKAKNPLKEEMPTTNPFKAETNPFKDVYQNPF